MSTHSSRHAGAVLVELCLLIILSLSVACGSGASQEEVASTDGPSKSEGSPQASKANTDKAPTSGVLPVSPEAMAEPSLNAPAPKVAMTPERAYPRTVGEAVEVAKHKATEAALNALLVKMEGEPKPGGQKSADADKPKGKLLSLWHTGNVRGEREDCGCKKNPRGGLTRKATMIQNAGKSGRDLDKPDGALVLDAGDLLFAGVYLERLAEKDKKLARSRAEAIIKSFNIIGCQAFLPGEYDLALGVDTLMALKKQAKFPWISANLRRVGSKELLLPPTTLTEVAGFKVLIIGLTNPKGNAATYYKDKGVEVGDPEVALRAQAGVIKESGADVVILLSNLGLDGTRRLLEAVPRKDVPVTAALVSNTARSTYDPVWAGGVPIVEAGNRGKFIGRLDLHIVEGQVLFLPASDSASRPLRNLMAAHRSLHIAQRNVARLPAPTSDDDNLTQTRRKRMERNLMLAGQRLKRVQKDLPEVMEMPKPQKDAPKSWLHNQVIPVELSIQQDPKVRKLLDSYE